MIHVSTVPIHTTETLSVATRGDSEMKVLLTVDGIVRKCADLSNSVENMKVSWNVGSLEIRRLVSNHEQDLRPSLFLMIIITIMISTKFREEIMPSCHQPVKTT